MKLSLLNILSEEVVNFSILQAYVVRDLLKNPRVQGWFAAKNSSASDTGIMGVIGSHGMSAARSVVGKAATAQESPMLYDIPDVLIPYSRTPSIEHIVDMKDSAVYKEIYDLYLSYFK